MPAAPDAHGTIAPCPTCKSNLGSLKCEDMETAKAFEKNTEWLRKGNR